MHSPRARFSGQTLVCAAQVVALAMISLALGSAAELPRPAATLKVETVRGEIVNLDYLKGKVVIVMFFYSTCPVCHEATQNLNVIYEEWKSRGLEIIAIASNDSAKTDLPLFVQKFNVRFPVVLGDRAMWAGFGGFSLVKRPPYVPHMMFIDRQGIIREEHSGTERNYYNDLNLRSILDKYLKERPS